MSTLTEIRRIGFTVSYDKGADVEWFVEVSEWSDGSFSVFAERETDAYWLPGQFTDYDGIVFDHAPTAQEVLEELERLFDLETDAAATDWYERYA